MTAPASPGGPSPLRVGGFALLGVGVVAAVIGFATLAVGGNSSAAAAPSATNAPTTTTAHSAAPDSAPPADGSVPLPSFGASSTAGIAAPPATTVPPAPAPAPAPAVGSGGSSGGAVAARAPLRVYNNGTIRGLAAQAAQDFRNAGWTVTSEGNYPNGIISTSTVYYRPGTSEQAAAQALADQFGLRVEPRFAGLDDASPGLIVIVTNDYQRR